MTALLLTTGSRSLKLTSGGIERGLAPMRDLAEHVVEKVRLVRPL